MGISPELRTKLRSALLDAFRTLDELDQLVQDALHTNRVRITTSSGLDAIVDDLLVYCEAKGSIAALVCVAYNLNPSNELLSHLMSQAGTWPELAAAGLVLIDGTAFTRALRNVELLYLDKLIQRYTFGTHRYTALPGIAEIEEGQVEEPLPPEFQRLAEYGYGPDRRTERVPVEDVREAVEEYRRLVILGEPGSGKTTTLRRLTVEYARAAQSNATATLPLYVELGSYMGDEPVLEFVCNQVRDLADYVPAYLYGGHAFLFLDALNEMPRGDYAARVQRVQEFLTQFPDLPVVVTCRLLDYVEALKLEKLEIQPLDVDRVRTFSHGYLGEETGETFFRQLAGEDAAEVSPLLSLASNPYMLRMLTVVFRNKGALPESRGKLLNAYTGTLWAREKAKHGAYYWPGETVLTSTLSHLATEMQTSGVRGTAVARKWAIERLAPMGVQPDQALYLAASANLVDISDEQVRFVHQLLQEYFAALAMRTQLEKGADFAVYWPDGWVGLSGWEETTILLAGMLDDMAPLMERLLSVIPALAARCIAESGRIRPAGVVVKSVQSRLVAIATSSDTRVAERNAAGNALNYLGDARPGVGLTPDGLPDIVWCSVPAGGFLMGNTKQTDEVADDREAPQHKLHLDAFRIAKYPVTNEQYAQFVQATGRKPSFHWRGKTPPRELRNHPVVNVTWYDAMAYCAWLSEVGGEVVRLPTEAEWEKAARGTDGRRYPWGDRPDANLANYSDTGIRTTSAVGCFPNGASPYGCEDMAGNVWEWTSSKYAPYPYDPDDGREDAEGTGRSLRGGSWALSEDFVRCAYRFYWVPFYSNVNYGFRVVSSPGG